MGKDVMSFETSAVVEPAPRWRRTLAGAADAATIGAVAWWWHRRGASAARGTKWGRLLQPATDLLGVQLRSPGQLLLRIRSVDRRTGRRVALWRTLLLSGCRVAGELLIGRLPAERPERERQREGFVMEMNAIMERHPRASPARDAERQELFDRYPGPSPVRLAAPVAIGLLNSVLRRRLVPTVQVRARSESHNP